MSQKTYFEPRNKTFELRSVFIVHEIFDYLNYLSNILGWKFFDFFRSIIFRTFRFENFSSLGRNFYKHSRSKVFQNISDQKFFKHFGSEVFRTFRIEIFSNISGRKFFEYFGSNFLALFGSKMFRTFRIGRFSNISDRKFCRMF